MSKIIKGWCVVQPVMFGLPGVWTVEELYGEGVLPEVFPTEDAAWKDIARDQIEILQQYIDGEREFDYVDWSGPDAYVAQVKIDEQDNLLIWDEDRTIIEMSLEDWRKSL